ncbi:MAG: hypothetical protein ACOYK6_01130 [Chthoniobacterales bacterium]
MYSSIKSIISVATNYFSTTSGTKSSTSNSSAAPTDVTGQAHSSKNSFLNLFNKWNFFATPSSSSVQPEPIEMVSCVRNSEFDATNQRSQSDIDARIRHLDSDKNKIATSSSSSVQPEPIEMVSFVKNSEFDATNQRSQSNIDARIRHLDSDKHNMSLRCAVDKALIYLQVNKDDKARECLTEAVETVFSQSSYDKGKDPKQLVDVVLDILKRQKPLPDDELNGSKSTKGELGRKNTVMKEVLEIIIASNHWETINLNK